MLQLAEGVPEDGGPRLLHPRQAQTAADKPLQAGGHGGQAQAPGQLLGGKAEGEEGGQEGLQAPRVGLGHPGPVQGPARDQVGKHLANQRSGCRSSGESFQGMVPV